MNSKLVIAVACALVGASRVFAGTIDFEAAPADTSTDLGSFYQGVTFGPDAQVISQLTPTFPAHSGNQELTDNNFFNNQILATFDTPQNEVSFWFTAYNPGISFEAFDIHGGLLSSNFYAGNIDPGTQVGGNTFADIKTNGISYIEVTDQSGAGTFLTIDDFSAPGLSGLPAPDASSTFALLGFAGAGLVALRRKFVTR